MTDREFHSSVRDGDSMTIDPERETLQLGNRSFRAAPASGIAFDIESAGGIVAAFVRHGSRMLDVLTSTRS